MLGVLVEVLEEVQERFEGVGKGVFTQRNLIVFLKELPVLPEKLQFYPADTERLDGILARMLPKQVYYFAVNVHDISATCIVHGEILLLDVKVYGYPEINEALLQFERT